MFFFSLSLSLNCRIPFTIQRLCELLTEPKRNYTGTDKFLRGVEKVRLNSIDFPCKSFVSRLTAAAHVGILLSAQNVMVVSCVHPTSE